MNQILKLGLVNNVFTTENIAELIFGKLETNVDNVDLKAKTGTMFISWKLQNFEVFPETLRRDLLLTIRGRKDFNYDFVLPRILCALGYQCQEKGFAKDIKHTPICWTTLYTPITPHMAWGETLAIREVLRWHDWEMPYTTEEILLLQNTVCQQISLRQEWFDSLPDERKENISTALSLHVHDITSGKIYLLNKLYELLIEMKFNADPAW